MLESSQQRASNAAVVNNRHKSDGIISMLSIMYQNFLDRHDLPKQVGEERCKFVMSHFLVRVKMILGEFP